MSRFGGFFSKVATPAKHDAWSGPNEAQALQDAMQSAAKIMNDGIELYPQICIYSTWPIDILIVGVEVEQAEAELKDGASPFHKVGRATAIFFRAVLGFEKQFIEEATARLLEAEESASECHRKALKDPKFAYRSEIYPPGAEYALCHAESQLMLAVVGILNESLMETLRSFQRLRKAFSTLHEIVEAEKKYLATHKSSFSTPSLISAPSGTQTPAEDDDVFEDAEEFAEPRTSHHYQGHMDLPDIKKLNIDDQLHDEDDDDIRKVTDHPIDLFIHSGTSLCHGLLQLLLSMVPPTFSRVLSFFSFQGDRSTGLKELWTATNYKHNINGAMAGMVLLTFHNTAINLCDILLPTSYPTLQLQTLLNHLLTIYPNSKLWPLEQSRMHGFAHSLPLALTTLTTSPPSTLRQLEALRLFETSLNTLFLHDYPHTTTLFLSCVGKNDWSHALYYFIAGICHVEQYRDTRSPAHAHDAVDCFTKSYASLGRKKFMARPLPFDAYVGRKLEKWGVREAGRGGAEEVVGRVGVSPVVEMIYFWSGFKKQDGALLEVSMERLRKVPPGKGWERDEVVVWETLWGTLLRFRHPQRPVEAREYLAERVVGKCTLQELRGCSDGKGDTWPIAVAHYETAVCHFLEAELITSTGEEEQKQRTTSLEECAKELDIVSRFGDGGGSGFELNARVGLKVTQGKETLRSLGMKV